MGVEAKINNQLNKYPVVKKYIKRVYQRTMYTIFPKIKSEGSIVKVSPDDSYHEYFFGYYDKSPWDATDQYMLCLKAEDTWSNVSPRETAQIILIDTTKENKVTVLAETHSWNVQQGCMLQWLGPDYSDRVLYNDFRNGKYCSVILHLSFDRNGIKAMEEKIIPAPVYSVSSDGIIALTLDFARLHRLRPGYGYYNMPEKTANQKLPDETCIWRVNLMSGEVIPVLKYTDFAQFEPRQEMDGAEHKVNHIMLSPNGKRFMVLHRWFNGHRKYTRLVTCNVDGSDMYNLSDDDMVSHCYWRTDGQIFAFEHKKHRGNGYYLMKDRTQKFKRFWPGIDYDGHPSYSPNGSMVVFDCYPDRARIAAIMVSGAKARKDSDVKVLVRAVAPFKYDNDTRCDFHPRWNRNGSKICFDSVFEGHRGLYVVDVEEGSASFGKIKVAFVFTACKQSGPIEQMVNLLRCLDREIFEPILITLYDEAADGSSKLDQYLELGVKHYYCPHSKLDLVSGRTKSLKELLEKLDVDVIHSLGVFPDYSIAKMKTGKQIITLRNYVWEDYPAKFGKIQGMVLGKLHLYAMKHTAITVTCSKSLSELYRKNLKLHYRHICNGVDVERYKNATYDEKMAYRNNLNLPKDAKILVYSGQIIERKNQSFLLAAFTEKYEMVTDVYLLVLGDGADYVELSERYGNVASIDFRGNVSNVEEYLRAADIYVSTSKSEGMPNGVLEAMAAGLPVVLSDIPQHQEVLEANSNAGLLYRQGDKHDLQAKLDEILSVDLDIAGKSAYKAAHEAFSDSIMSEKYQDLYKEIANKERNNEI